MKMKGNISDEEDGINATVAKPCGVSATDDVSRLGETIEAKEVTKQKDKSKGKFVVPNESEKVDNECTSNSEVLVESKGADDMEEEDEQWDLKKIMSIAAVIRRSPIKCSHETCNLVAATVWVSNLKPSESWYSCLDCQVRQGC
jgi:hypothetical protein